MKAEAPEHVGEAVGAASVERIAAVELEGDRESRGGVWDPLDQPRRGSSLRRGPSDHSTRLTFSHLQRPGQDGGDCPMLFSSRSSLA